MTMTLNNLEGVERVGARVWEHAEVIEPEELRDRVGEASRKIQRKYSGGRGLAVKTEK